METCIFCDNSLTRDTKPEHILLNALGGRKTTTRVVCSECNGAFGSTIDDEIAQQVIVLRNMLHLNSGSGRAPPMLKNIGAGSDVLNLTSDGRPELVAKPFTIRKLEDGRFDLEIKVKSPEEAAQYIPHIAAQLGCTDQQVLEILSSGTGTLTARKPDTVHHNLSFGGALALRSVAKSSLVLWTLAAGTTDVKSPSYDDVRHFVLHGDEVFNKACIGLDSRHLPQADELKRRFGRFFNLIYVKSDDAGRVIAHFTLYNIVSWRIVLAEAGGIPNTRIALVSNPLDPAIWSDSIAEVIDIDFAWLDGPDHDLVRARERLDAAMRHYFETETPRELHRIADDVFAGYGIVSDDEPIADPELLNKIIWDISRRVASHALNLPHVENLTGAEVVARLKDALLKPG
jgi:hypothetical protein